MKEAEVQMQDEKLQQRAKNLEQMLIVERKNKEELE